MAGVSDEDPFDWDVDTVCRQLCYDGAPWTSDAATLQSNVRENFLDGETLLTYELVFSRDKLMKCLGIKAARHQMKLGMKIINLQAKSRTFHSEKLAIAGTQQGAFVDEKSLPPQKAVKIDQNNSQDGKATAFAATGFDANPDALTSPNAEPDDGEAPLKKRRRIAPSLLTTVPIDSAVALRLAPEADKFNVAIQTNSDSNSSPSDAKVDTSTAYLGERAITKQDILGRNSSLGSDSDNGDDFLMLSSQSRFIPPGKRKAVHNILKRQLNKNSHKVAIIQAGGRLDSMSGVYDSDDEIIHCSDASDGPDEQTLREMAEEEEERAALAASNLNTPRVPEERVQAVVNEAIRDMTTKWEATKKPRCERKAYMLWTRAQKFGQLQTKATEAEKRAQFHDMRIKRIIQEFATTEWQNESELRAQTRSVEQNVEDKLYHSWLVSLYMSRTVPEKPQGISRPKQPSKKHTNLQPGEEVLDSSEEDDFIVPDKAKDKTTLPPVARVDGLKSDTKQKQVEEPVVSVADGHTAESTTKVIDLTTASDNEIEAKRDDSNGDTNIPSVDDFSRDDLAAIGQVSPKTWASQKDRWRLIISLLWKLRFGRRKDVFDLLQKPDDDSRWEASIGHLINRTTAAEQPTDGATLSAAVDLTVIFLNFMKCKYQRESRVIPINSRDKDRLNNAGRQIFPSFCSFVMSISSSFPDESQIYRADELDNGISDIELENSIDANASPAAAPKPRKPVKEIVQDKGAIDLRERERQRIEDQERRRDNLRSALAANSSMSVDKSRLIINESKQDDQAFIYINEFIGSRIKDHQIEGVRFLWNQVVVDINIRQGCLLAHTMGLGKTMQTITFLVAILEAACSNDRSVRDQVPEDLRECRTLILCPSGLVENWLDELLIWAPRGIFGNIHKVEATQSVDERAATIADWGERGGILIMGYNMFKKSHKHGQAKEDAMDTILTDCANIVIADEAHVLKNPNAKISQLSLQFQTRTRIALTGSPLANNVEEYYSMINWVAPNFLGPLQEFRQIYATPIQQGLWNDSTTYEKRKAVKLLQALKDTVASKVNRATIKSCLKDDLPPKYEFVISVPPTSLQRNLYHLFIDAVHNNNAGTKTIEQARVFGIINNLGLICAHPSCFRKKTEEVQNLVQSGKGTGSFPVSIIPNALRATGGANLLDQSFSRKVELLTLILDECRRAEDKVLVFSQSIPTIDYLMDLYSKQGRRICRLDGSTPISKRQDMIKGFNSGEEEIYLISTTAGGVGLNIHGANRVVIFDFKWNPVNDQQAIGRAYRIGQRKTVFVYRFVIAGTFEDDLQNKAVFKTQLASRVVDKKNPISWSKQMRGLLHPIKEVPALDLAPFMGKDSVLDTLITSSKEARILSIVSTDTFEEEDESVSLTAEEKREAASMVQRNRLRASDPIMDGIAQVLALSHRQTELVPSSYHLQPFHLRQ
ncbi:hypothetical protein K4F52_005741 [Lecanicillium sp. MT-2017a]|nr:hypothetical protein K4F52_005741 [Lecanicillium sp. MT-2017a]